MESQPDATRSVPPGSLPPPQARRRIPDVDNSKEAAAYRMLRQVLHNHLTTQGLTVLSALAAVGRLLGHLAWHLHGLGYDLQRFADDTRAQLGGQLLARLREGDVPLVVWSKYSNAAFFKAFRPVLTLSPIFRGTGRVLPLEMLGWRGRLQGLRRRDEQKTFTLGRGS